MQESLWSIRRWKQELMVTLLPSESPNSYSEFLFTVCYQGHTTAPLVYLWYANHFTKDKTLLHYMTLQYMLQEYPESYWTCCLQNLRTNLYIHVYAILWYFPLSTSSYSEYILFTITNGVLKTVPSPSLLLPPSHRCLRTQKVAPLLLKTMDNEIMQMGFTLTYSITRKSILLTQSL